MDLRLRHLRGKMLVLAVTLGVAGCGVSFLPTPKGAVVGRSNVYDYSPSIIQSGNLQQFWWCGGGNNPNDSEQVSDIILYESIDLSTHQRFGPVPVLGETPGSWDAAYTCNPKVIRGAFSNPLGDGETYTYAMYYVGTASKYGIENAIGVAFSNDGKLWKKLPQPVIPSTSDINYGVGQPALYNSNGKSAIWMFYENNNPASVHIEAVSSDGVHFSTQGTLTTNGLDPGNPNPTWGDMGFDPETGYWYAVFNLPTRPVTTTEGISERGGYGFQLYRIQNASLLTGATPWEFLMNVDTNLTGYESNFIPGLLRDMYGNVNIGSYPSIEMYPSISNPQPSWNASSAAAALSGDVAWWDIGGVTWNPNISLPALDQYANSTVHEVTTGWIDPSGGFQLQSTLGHLYPVPEQGATVALYGCKNGAMDYFLSLDSACEGQRILGTNGYGYSQPVAGLNLVPLYRCYTGHDHFVSTNPSCEGQQMQLLLGYALP